MMRRLALVIGSIAAVALGASAHAADKPGSWPPPFEMPQQGVTEYVSGWYVRGDAGWRTSKIGSVESPVPTTTHAIDKVASVGGGFGYKYQFVRADVTLDYGMRGRISAGTGANPTSYNGKIDSLTTLGNVYLDLGSWAGLTPYVGVGGGFSRLNLTEFNGQAVPAQDTWRFSWAWMIGASYQFTSHFAIDVGYRFLKLGDAVSGPDAAGSKVSFKDVTAQEIRIGFRYLID